MYCLPFQHRLGLRWFRIHRQRAPHLHCIQRDATSESHGRLQLLSVYTIFFALALLLRKVALFLGRMKWETEEYKSASSQITYIRSRRRASSPRPATMDAAGWALIRYAINTIDHRSVLYLHTISHAEISITGFWAVLKVLRIYIRNIAIILGIREISVHKGFTTSYRVVIKTNCIFHAILDSISNSHRCIDRHSTATRPLSRCVERRSEHLNAIFKLYL